MKLKLKDETSFMTTLGTPLEPSHEAAKIEEEQEIVRNSY